jgi:rubrerythrin
MPLTNFGAILNFAEQVERDDMDFYTRVAQAAPESAERDRYQTFAGEGKKHVTLVQRTRRENVTEMILEPICDFERGRYQVSADEEFGADPAAIRKAAVTRETRAIGYYTDAAEKIRALPEVSRALKTLAKKRSRRLDQLLHHG